MKAIVYDRFGPPEVMRVAELPKPVPGDREVLVHVRATTATAADWRARSLVLPRGFGPLGRLVFGFGRPRQPILGMECAGEIEAIGKAVRTFKVGDPVIVFTSMRLGCCVEYKCVPEDGAIALKPANLGFDEAAALTFGGLTALKFLRAAKVRPGEEVLVNGASGSTGTMAVQYARHLGARVTGVCSAGNAELVRSLGADRVIDYAREDFTRSGVTWDVVVDCVGNAPFERVRPSLRRGGRLLLVVSTLPEMLRAPWQSLTSGRKVIAGPVGGGAADLRTLASLAGAGALKVVIDRRYPFEQVVEAHRYLDTGRKRGSLVLTP
jgi:NADPH:quinone reductase-like Zn-dependent oxidoreductase